jgi:putative ABC transport system permease protein
MHLVIRTEAAPESFSESIQREIHAIDPDQPVSNVLAMDVAIEQAMPRFNVSLLILFAGIAWLLSTIGVYGVTAHGVTRRTREIGIRMALGASARDMLAMVLRETLGVGAIAVVVGLVGAIGVSRAMVGLLYGVTPTDAGAVLSAVIALFIALIVAAFVPARRASLIHPNDALRAD